MKKILVINVLLAIALGSCSTEDVQPLKKITKDKMEDDPGKNFPPPPLVSSFHDE